MSHPFKYYCFLRFDPTQVKEGERFRNWSIGDSSMLAGFRIEDWKHRSDSVGHRSGKRSDSFGQRFGNFNSKFYDISFVNIGVGIKIHYIFLRKIRIIYICFE